MIEVKKVSQSRVNSVDFKKLRFGEEFADHMFVVDYHDGEWINPVIMPFGNFEISPATSILHYGQGVFEGMKAFWYKEGKISIFRPEEHYKRLLRSCKRMDIPKLERDIFFDGLTQLINLDRNWVPKEKYKSLYIRPFVIATDEFIGVRTAKNYRFMIITSPVGNYYSEGIKPVLLTTMPEYSRAALGGVGEAKTLGNYAASLYPARIAKEQGFTQVLWLDSAEKKYVEEVGTMNIFFVIDDVLITPTLGGSILSGITRKTVLELARGMDMKVEERKISIDELIEAYNSGKLQEAFGTGTAAVISPVGLIHHMGTEIILNRDEMGPVASNFYKQITSIHHGELDPPDDWCHIL